MFRGIYDVDFGDGRKFAVPNHFTTHGVSILMRCAMRDENLRTTFIGLCSGNPGAVVSLGDIGEPTAGVGGYARQDGSFTAGNWPIVDVINGEVFIKSVDLTFPRTAAWDKQVSRLFMIDTNGYVMSVSTPIPGGLQSPAAPVLVNYSLFIR